MCIPLPSGERLPVAPYLSPSAARAGFWPLSSFTRRRAEVPVMRDREGALGLFYIWRPRGRFTGSVRGQPRANLALLRGTRTRGQPPPARGKPGDRWGCWQPSPRRYCANNGAWKGTKAGERPGSPSRSQAKAVSQCLMVSGRGHGRGGPFCLSATSHTPCQYHTGSSISLY
ncbi:hypothetical protein NDU88_006709 [Pleurodeles waltl]|uniref:Uncharacterized protein n=1 Tax=Pleurodeles waltl TaxID=8319 RepID=A0AAV7LRK9_PLEWA|nr:hypothetical protein NDU88_006709 [Pleurodeles waltl]